MIGGYGAAVTTTNVVQSGTVRLDLHLPAGRLSYIPPSMAISLTLGMSATVPFTLTNNGTLAVNWGLSELPNAPWLTETPATDIIAPMASQVIRATFDANLPQVIHPGDQSAGLRINHDTPYVLADVPVTLTVVAPDLVISQSGPAAARAGETVTYTIYYTNSGTVTANNVTIRDTLPASTTSTVEPVWSLVSLTAGMSGVIEFTATLESGLTFDTLLANHVTITSTNDEFDTTDNNAWFTTTVVARPTAGFVSSSPGTLGQATWFTNTTFGTLPIAYTWDFGDGTPPLVGVKDPSHVYTNAGAYTAWLTATNAYGQDTISGTVTIILYRSYLPLVIKDQG